MEEESMRTRTVLLLVVICVSALTASSALADSCGKTQAETVEKAEKVEKTEAKTEEAKPVTATLQYFKHGKGEKLSKDVEYLPMGKKIATMETSKGVVKIELWEDKAPNTVINFVSLANAGKYDGVIFHRVIDGFMAQTGDVEHKKGTGGPGYSIPAEFDANLKHTRGVVSMARASDPNSGGSQFFIMFASASHLDGSYAAFGKVIEGMDVIDKITKGDGPNGSFVNSKEDKIVKLRVESVQEKKAEKKVEKKVEEKVEKKAEGE
jgi:peptidyl-prolyl cis-trans isomerase B (cyclophilin B)